MKSMIVLTVVLLISTTAIAGKYTGQHSSHSFINQGASDKSMDLATGSSSSKLYDKNSIVHEGFNGNQYNADSVAGPFGKYGNKKSSESIDNSYGLGDPFSIESPNAPLGKV